MIDDIDNIEIPDGESETIKFGLDGQSFEIDLNTENAAGLRKALEPYIKAGRKQKAASKSARKVGATPAVSSLSGKRTEAETIRAWAKEQGHPVAERGRIPADVRSAYLAAIKQPERLLG